MYLMDQIVLVSNASSPGDALYSFADYVYQHFSDIKDMTIEELATACSTSPATISRLVGRFGFSSYRDFRKECAELTQSYRCSRTGYDHFMLSPQNVVETLGNTLGPAAARITNEQLDLFLTYLLPPHAPSYVIGLANMHTIAMGIQFAVASYQSHTILAPANFRDLAHATSDNTVIVLTTTGNAIKTTDLANLLRLCPARRLIVTTSNYDPAGVPCNDVISLWSPARQHLINNYLMQLFVDMALCRGGLYD